MVFYVLKGIYAIKFNLEGSLQGFKLSFETKSLFISSRRRMVVVKVKKMTWLIVVVVVLICLIVDYIFKPMTMNDIYHEPNFTGVIAEVHDKSIVVSVNDGEGELKSSNKMRVSLDVKLKDSMTTFNVGQQVKIFYDGVILESYPAKIDTVYAILLVNK